MPGSFSSNHSNTGPAGVAALRKVTSGALYGDSTQTPFGIYKDSLKPNADRRKVGALYVAARKWVKVDQDGSSSIIQAEKNELTHRLGVQLRDLRVLDPLLAASYPSAILARDRALVVNLEHIKCIIATDHVLVTNAEDDTVLAFVEELQRRCASAPDTDSSNQDASQSSPDVVVMNGEQGDMTRENMFPFLEIPYELRVLEVVLESVCTHLERLTSELEAAAHPALDALTNKVSTHNLERVRRIKNRMVRLNTRVETIHELLEKLLDDDDDMKDLNLTAKQLEMERTVSLQRNSLKAGQPPGSPLFGAEPEDDDADAQEVEMVLETYFMHIDNTYNKLQTLTEYIDDTEDYINIELDNQRNQLIRIELVLTAATFSVAIIGSIAGIFGMNLNNQREDSYAIFLVVTLASTVGAVLIFAAVIAYCRHKKLLA
ncbi:hypothetical protein ABBQ32_013974 [Trebouxia sp. C0010 RCD-2024]